MISDDEKKAFYQAMVEKKTEYEGVFFVGSKATHVFCRPTCPARKPKFENCEFYKTAQQAISASFRPCKRCCPLSHPNQVSKLIQTLVEEIEKNPEKRWKAKDFQQLSVDVSTARRQFKKRFGMTFVEYARAHRMGIAMNQIKSGEAVIDAQLSTGYESSSGFRNAFSRIMGAAPTKLMAIKILKTSWLDTPLGPLLAIADEEALYLLKYVDRRSLDKELDHLRKKTKSTIIPGRTRSISLIESELMQYFAGELKEFKTPLILIGTPFQKLVWEEIGKIPHGETRSYSEIAEAIGKPTAHRAVARETALNPIAIVIPCHRVIHKQGDLGSYGGGLSRKKWLINHEMGEP